MSTLSMIPGATLLTSRPGNGPFGFLFQSEAAGSLIGQCGTIYLAVTAAVLILAVVASRAERRSNLHPSI